MHNLETQRSSTNFIVCKEIYKIVNRYNTLFTLNVFSYTYYSVIFTLLRISSMPSQ
jgi:hypothetical protein